MTRAPRTSVRWNTVFMLGWHCSLWCWARRKNICHRDSESQRFLKSLSQCSLSLWLRSLMESFFSFLEKRVDDCSSLLCIGLDPHFNDLSAPTAASARDFCLNLVKQTSRYAAAFKPNAAFFEVFGADGWTALKEVIDAIQAESNRMGSMIPVILDAKRIGRASCRERV